MIPPLKSAVSLARRLSSLPAQAISSLFSIMARVRHARAVHPRGVTFSAHLTVTGWNAPIPPDSYSAKVRLSKGAGIPGRWPDVLGIAVRVQPSSAPEPWDFLFSSAGHGRLTRWLPAPAADWNSAHYSTLGPYETAGRQSWLMLTPEYLPVRHASVDDLRHLAPSVFTLHVSGESARWSPIGRLELDTPITQQLTFDPVLNHPPHAVPAPPWLRELRRLAYEGSREGRQTQQH